MIHKIIEIGAPGYEEKAKLYTYFLDNSAEMHPDQRRPVIVICPGGGYEFTSDREAEPLAMRFLAMGYHVAVLRYSCYPAEYPVALLQLASTVCYLKEHAEEYHIDPTKVIVQGSSAGGHLAASYGVFWNKGFLSDTLEVDPEVLGPAGLILSYPVITSGEFAHQGSFQHLLGERYVQLKEEMSLEKQVNSDVPPTFLWHTMPDDVVPAENSILFFMALKNAGVPTEMHIYPWGGHGLGLANYETQNYMGYGVQEECQSWIKLVEIWMKQFNNY